MERRNIQYQTVNSCEIEVPPPCGLIIFGASGDLTARKLIPSLYRLFRSSLLPDRFFILGMGREQMTSDGFRDRMRTAVLGRGADASETGPWRSFADRMSYCSFSYCWI